MFARRRRVHETAVGPQVVDGSVELEPQRRQVTIPHVAVATHLLDRLVERVGGEAHARLLFTFATEQTTNFKSSLLNGQ